MPIIGLIAGAMFGGSSLVAVFCLYFIGMAAIICSGVILKKTKLFAGDPAPFVMELPAYHVPAWGNVFRATWERGWSFIKRAGSVIPRQLPLCCGSCRASVSRMVPSAWSRIRTTPSWPLSLPRSPGSSLLWASATGVQPLLPVSGLIAKENVVGTFGVLYHFGGELSENGDEIWAAVAQDYTALSAYAFYDLQPAVRSLLRCYGRDQA